MSRSIDAGLSRRMLSPLLGLMTVAALLLGIGANAANGATAANSLASAKVTSAVTAPISALPKTSATSAANAYPQIGRPATSNEIAAWNIDVRPDWQGLPPGSGSVAQGQVVWDAQCASCHGSFGESNQVFTPITGGTTKADIVSGRVAALANNSQPQRSSLMKLATLSTLFDYIRRAMPWNAPKTLSNDQVYAVTAYILNLGDIVPDDFVLSDKNIAQVQLPNRNGLQRNHGMWKVDGKGDVANIACMQNCAVNTEVRSFLPASARNAHGNLALQQRSIGPNRGVDTAPGNMSEKSGGSSSSSSSSSSSNATAASALPHPAAALPHPGAALAQQHGCSGCHAEKEKLVGPAFAAIAAKYQNQPDSMAKLTLKLQNGSSGTWGEIPMPSQSHVPASDIKALLQWILLMKP